MTRRPLLILALCAALLAACSSSGGDDEDRHLLLLQWQAPSIVNPYLSSGTKDVLSASLVLEPLAAIAPDGSYVPKLADEIPTVANGGIAGDLMSVTWRLKEGLLWSDGTPVTTEDLIFTWEWCVEPATGCAFTTHFAGITRMVALDERTLRIEFEQPTPNPLTAFVSSQSPVLQKAQFESCIGELAVACTEPNQYPVGTGPYVVEEFRHEDTVIYAVNPHWRGEEPWFRTVEIKGGGSATDAARTVLEEGGADYAWNLQIPPDIRAGMAAKGLGRVQAGFAANLEHLNLMQANNRHPDPEMQAEYLDGTNPHPLFHDNPALTRAMSMAIDRAEIVAVGYGDAGRPACNVWNAPPAVSPNNDWCLTRDVEGARRLLDEAGIVDTDGDGVREHRGIPLEIDFLTSTNEVRQTIQELLQSYWREIGIATHIRNVPAAVFFDGTGASPDSFVRGLADVFMFTSPVSLPDPQVQFEAYTLEQMTGRENGYGGGNSMRYHNPDFDRLMAELAVTADPQRRIDLAIRLNDILVSDGVVIPLVHRGSVSAFRNDIQGVGDLNGWDSEYWNIHEWRRASR